MQTKIGFIGSGNMAQSIALGLLEQNWNNQQLMVFSPNAASKAWIQQKQISIAKSISQLSTDCNVLILATKPQQAQQALASISLNSEQCLISVAAGISTQYIYQVLSANQSNQALTRVIRAMPNTPSLISSGVCGLYAETLTRELYADLAESIFSAIGSFVWIKDESLMDVVTAISGSGPAYYFLIVEGMISAAIELGMDKKSATKLATETLSGAAALLKSTELDPTSLRQQVTSPGGTTAAALESFKTDKLQQIIFNAVSAAKDRGILLNKECLDRLNTKP